MDFNYPDGLRFECNTCGLCCGDTPKKIRHILLLQREVEDIAVRTSRAINVFCTEVIDKFPYVYEMKKATEGKCVFLESNLCSIYSLRPLICRFYPFELKFDLKKEAHVFDFTLECPAINQGKVLSQKDFEKLFVLAQKRLG